MDSDSDQPCKRRCTEKDKVNTEDTSNQNDATDNFEVENEENGFVACVGQATDDVACSNNSVLSGTEQLLPNDLEHQANRSASPMEERDIEIDPDDLNCDDSSRQSSRSSSEEAVMPPDLLVDWVTSQNISSFTKPIQSAVGRAADLENMPSCSNASGFSRNQPLSPTRYIVDDTGESIPVHNLCSSSDSSDSDSNSDNQPNSARSDSSGSGSTFRIQPSRHTEMTLTFGGTGSRSNMTHTVLLGDGCNSRQSVKYVFNFRSMSDSATQTEPPTKEIAIGASDKEDNELFPLDFSMTSASEDEIYPNINRLPSNILLQIFKSMTVQELLCKVSLVCKTWYNLCRDPDLWRCINLCHQHKVNDAVLSKLTSYSDRVTSLNLEDTKLLTSHGLCLVCVKCKYLQQLKLTRCFSVEDEVLMMVGSSCRNLKNLNLDGCYRISDQWTCTVGEGCPDLRELVLSRCSQMTDTGICKIAKHCHHLQNIILDHCHKVTDQSVNVLAENCPDLKTLSLANCNITDTGICSIYKMKKLEYLDISNLPGGSITAAVVSQLTRYCDNLECLNVSLNLTIDDKCIQEVVKHGKKIKNLFCVNCSLSDEGLLAVSAHGRNLEKLDLGWCKDLTDRGIWAVIDNCPSLKYLGLIRCDSVSEKGVEAMVDKYPHIQFSTFFMESRKLIQKAIENGFKFMADSEQNK